MTATESSTPARQQRSRERNRAYVAEARAAATCAMCGGTPVEYHHDDHPARPGRRLPRLVNNQASLAQLQAELDRCTPLCHRCHQTLDGRLAKLAARPHPTLPPRPCAVCGTLANPLRRGCCRRCYEASRRC